MSSPEVRKAALAGGITSMRDHVGDVSLECDICIVGSGAGGAVVARTLAEAGHDVLVLEEGGHATPEQYGKWRPTESLRYMGREGGTIPALPIGNSPLVAIMAGRTVGGSSVLTGGVCFRIPESITQVWAAEHGLPQFTQKALEAEYADVEREVNVAPVPTSLRSRTVTLFDEGAKKMGFSLQPLRRNTFGCDGCGRCNFGCPHGAKLSVDVTYLRKAVRAGARIHADCLVEKLTIEGGKVVGVTGRIVDGPKGRKRGRLTVRAKHVVVAAGTLHTPVLLSKSGIGRASGLLGKGLTLHPTFRVTARFDERVDGWKGAFQNTFSDHFEHDGITLVSAFPPLSVIAAGLPGVGKSHADLMRQAGHLAVFGGMVHDDGGGRLWRIPGREPLVTYNMAKRDRLRMFKGTRILAEAFFLAGAREVILPFFGVPAIKGPDELGKIDPTRIPSRIAECTAFHPLGTARMGTDSRRGVVDPDGKSWEVENLHVIDGSLFPTSIGVNSQLPIMTVATRLAWRLRERLAARTPKAIAPNAA